MKAGLDVGGLILDLDGLLLDTEVVQRQAWQRAAAELGCSVSDQDFLPVVGRTTADTKAILVAMWLERGEPAQHYDEIYERKLRYVQGEPVLAKDGAAQLLAWAGEAGLPTAVGSSSAHATVTRRLAAAGLAGRVGVIAGGDEVAAGKPAPDIFLLAAERLGVPAARCLVLEDSDSGILAAHAAGMTAILVPDRSIPRAVPQEIEALAYARLGSLREVLALLR